MFFSLGEASLSNPVRKGGVSEKTNPSELRRSDTKSAGPSDLEPILFCLQETPPLRTGLLNDASSRLGQPKGVFWFFGAGLGFTLESS